jgi:thiamine biosynthesis lipoprotein
MFTPGTAEDESSHRKPPVYRCKHKAMATVFELYAFGDSRSDAEHAGELAFEEIDRLESELSFFLAGSHVDRLNRAKPGEPVRLSIDALDCLTVAQRVFRLTGGAFDPTAGARLRGRQSWKDSDGPVPAGSPPVPPHDAADLPSFDAIEIDRASRTATRHHPDVKVDLGAIGKGYAVDRAVTLLEDWLIGSTMLVAGRSTMRPLGQAPEGGLWAMGIRDPRDQTTPLDFIGLEEGSAISASSVVDAPHVLDPRTGEPAETALGAWAVAPSGGMSDALATAAVLMGQEALTACCQGEPSLAIGRFEPERGLEIFGQWRALRDKLGAVRDPES